MEFVSAFTLHSSLLPHEYKQLKVFFTGLDAEGSVDSSKNCKNTQYFIPKDVFFTSKASVSYARCLQKYLATHSIHDIVRCLNNTTIHCAVDMYNTENVVNIMQLCAENMCDNVEQYSVPNVSTKSLSEQKEVDINTNRMMLVLAFLLEESLCEMKQLYRNMQKQDRDFLNILHDVEQDMYDTVAVPLTLQEFAIDTLGVLKALAFFVNSDTILISTSEELFELCKEYKYLAVMPKKICEVLECMNLMQYVRGYLPSVKDLINVEDTIQKAHTTAPVIFFEGR